MDFFFNYGKIKITIKHINIVFTSSWCAFTSSFFLVPPASGIICRLVPVCRFCYNNMFFYNVLFVRLYIDIFDITERLLNEWSSNDNSMSLGHYDIIQHYTVTFLYCLFFIQLKYIECTFMFIYTTSLVHGAIVEEKLCLEHVFYHWSIDKKCVAFQEVKLDKWLKNSCLSVHKFVVADEISVLIFIIT